MVEFQCDQKTYWIPYFVGFSDHNPVRWIAVEGELTLFMVKSWEPFHVENVTDNAQEQEASQREPYLLARVKLPH